MAPQALKHALHAQPWDAELLLLTALVAAQLSSVYPAAQMCRAAEAACSAALAAAQRADWPVRLLSNGTAENITAPSVSMPCLAIRRSALRL